MPKKIKKAPPKPTKAAPVKAVKAAPPTKAAPPAKAVKTKTLHPVFPWLEANDLSRAWLARRLGVSRGLVAQWASGRCKPSLDADKQISEIMRRGL